MNEKQSLTLSERDDVNLMLFDNSVPPFLFVVQVTSENYDTKIAFRLGVKSMIYSKTPVPPSPKLPKEKTLRKTSSIAFHRFSGPRAHASSKPRLNNVL